MSSARPLRLWLAPRIALAGLVPLAVVAALVLGVLLPQLRADLEIRYQALARAIAGQIETYLLDAGRELRAIAQDLRDRGDQPPSSWFGPLDAHAGTGDVFAAIYITDPGDSVCAVGLPQAERGQRGDLLELDLSKWAVLREARERNQAVWSETFLSAVTGRLAVTLAIPVAEHTLVGEIAIDRLSEFIGRSPAESGMVTMILDRRGQIIAHSRAALSGQQISLGHLPIVRDALEGFLATRSFELDGERLVGTPVGVPQLGWVVLVAQPRSEAFRPFWSTLWVLAAGALVALPLAVLVALALARGFARRIGRYTEQAHAIAEGDYDQPWPVSHIREFDGLAGDLDRMSLAIRQRERDLATSEARYRSVIGSAPVVIFQFDGQGVFSLSEGKGLASVGLAANEAVGQSLFELYRDSPEVCEYARRAIGGEISRFISRIGGAYFDTYFNPVQDNDGHIQVISVSVDITERQRAEEALRQANLVVENSPAMLFRWKAEDGWPVAFVSHNVTQLGYSPEELLDGSFRFASLVYPEDLERIGHELRGYSERGVDQFQQEYRIVAKDGTLRWVDDRTVVERNSRGEITHYQGIVIDITERKRDSEILRRSETDLQLALEVARLGHWKWDIRSGEVIWSERCKALYGLPPDTDVTYDLFLSSVHPDDRARTDALLREALEKRSGYELEKRVVWPDGSVRWTSSLGRVICDTDNQPMLMAGVTLDITERKQAEEALQLTQFAMDRASVAVCWAKSDGRYQYVNDEMCRSLGYSREELLAMSVLDVNAEFTPEHWRTHWRELKAKRALALESKRRAKNGRIFPIELFVNYFEYGGEGYSVAFIRDITERKQAEEAIRTSEEKYRLLVDHQTDLIVKVDPDNRFLYVSPSYCQTFGKTEEELLGQTFMPLVHEEDRESTAKAMEDLFRPPYRDYHEQRAWTNEGWRWFGWADTAVLNDRGQVVAIVGAGRDITERKKMEESLRLTQFSVDRASDSIVWVDDEGKLIYVNDAACASMGYGREELLSMKVFDIDPDFLPDGFEEHKAELRRLGSMKFESRHRTKDGRLFPVEVTTNYFEYNGRFHGFAFDRDISERKRAEAELQRYRERLEELVAERTAELRQAMTQLVQAEKLAALGHLVAGVAHELNTPLGNSRVVASGLGEALREFETGIEAGGLRRSQLETFLERGREAVDLLERNAARAADLIGHFKQVAVDQASARRRRFNLRQTVEELLATLRPQFKRTVHRVELDIPPDLELDSYPGPLEQVVANLVSNSLIHGFAGIEAGVIRISAAARDDGHVQIDCADDGVGIPEALHCRIFDPFFTTRMGQGGSGLGLYIVYNLVTGVLGGAIRVCSQSGQGATFTLTLPPVAPDGPEPLGLFECAVECAADSPP